MKGSQVGNEKAYESNDHFKVNMQHVTSIKISKMKMNLLLADFLKWYKFMNNSVKLHNLNRFSPVLEIVYIMAYVNHLKLWKTYRKNGQVRFFKELIYNWLTTMYSASGQTLRHNTQRCISEDFFLVSMNIS